MNFRHEPSRRRFVVDVEGGEGVLDYEQLSETVLDYTHTFVPPALRRRGIATKLVEHALDHACENGMQVVPSCWFVAQVIRENPAYRDVVAGKG